MLYAIKKNLDLLWYTKTVIHIYEALHHKAKRAQLAANEWPGSV